MKENAECSIFLISVDTLIAVGNVKEIVFLVVFLIECAHGGASWRNDVVDKEEQGVFGSQMNPFADQEVKLSHRQVGRNQILLFVQIANPGFRSFLNNYLGIQQMKMI